VRRFHHRPRLKALWLNLAEPTFQPDPPSVIVIALGSCTQGQRGVAAACSATSHWLLLSWCKKTAAGFGGFDLPFGLPRELVETSAGRRWTASAPTGV
jgi:hypothetical protein